MAPALRKPRRRCGAARRRLQTESVAVALCPANAQLCPRDAQRLWRWHRAVKFEHCCCGRGLRDAQGLASGDSACGADELMAVERMLLVVCQLIDPRIYSVASACSIGDS
jgi:hypothetical protein